MGQVTLLLTITLPGQLSQFCDVCAKKEKSVEVICVSVEVKTGAQAVTLGYTGSVSICWNTFGGLSDLVGRGEYLPGALLSKTVQKISVHS